VRYLTGLLGRKRAAPGEDLLTDLVRAADQDGALSEQEMLSTIFQLVVAGHDTTTSLIGNGTAALLAHPDQRDALAADRPWSRTRSRKSCDGTHRSRTPRSGTPPATSPSAGPSSPPSPR
jgi:cytochrome P450